MAGDNWSPTDILSGLPPTAQAIVLLGAGAMAAFLFWRKYMRQSRDDSAVDQYAVGDPTTFADMGSVKQLVKNVDVLTLQMVKREVTDNELSANVVVLVKSMSALCDLMGAYLVDIREQRQEDELDDARKEGFAAGQASRPQRTQRRRATPRKTNTG